MKKLLMSATAISMLAGAAAAAAELRFNDTARVVDVTPVYKTIQTYAPRQVCEDRTIERTRYETRTRTVTEQVDGSKAGDVAAGAIIGGILGKGATKSDEGAVIGAIIGGAIANENSNGGSRTVTREITERVPVKYYTTERVCSTVTNPSQEIAKLQQRIAQTERWAASGNRDLIRKLQRRVGVTADGVAGPATRRATTRYIWGLEDRIQELQSAGGTPTRVVDYYKVSARYNNQRFFFETDERVRVGETVPVTVSVDVK